MRILAGVYEMTESAEHLRFAERMIALLDEEATILHKAELNAIRRELATAPYDLVILPWTNSPRFDQTTRLVVSRAGVSILVLKGLERAIRKVLVCSGGHPIAEPVIETGAWLGEKAGAKVTLLHVTGPVPSMYTGLGAMDENIEEMLSRSTPEAEHLRQGARILYQHHVEADVELRHGVPVEEIMRSVQVNDYDVIVIGASDTAPRVNRLLVGGIMQKVLERATCSVLVVRSGGLARLGM